MKSEGFDWSVTAALYSDGPLTYPDPLTHPEHSHFLVTILHQIKIEKQSSKEWDQ